MVNISPQNSAFINFKANVMPKNQAKHIDNILHSGKSADIFCHTLSDEDSFNSATAFYNYLEKTGVKPRIIVSGGKSNYGYDTSKYNIIQAKDVNESTEKADVALCVDFSSKDRLNTNVYNHLQKFSLDKIVGIDHHNDKNKIHPSFNHITHSYEKNKVPELEAKNYYIDSSARANCAIIYRFFEALGIKPDKKESGALFTGMMDDIGKNSKNLDKNTKEIKSKLMSGTSLIDLFNIKRHFDKKTSFSKAEKNFANNLENRLQYSKNGKFAYIEIEQNDKEWNSIGKNTTKSVAILNDFRKNRLKKNKQLETVAVFYPCDDDVTYKMSMTSNKSYAKKIVDFAKQNYDKKIIAGGHLDRCGGILVSNNTKQQKEWINNFIKAAENISY